MCHGRLDFTWIQSFGWFPFCHYSWHCYVPFGTYPHLKLFYFQNLQLPSSFSWLKASLSVPLIHLPMIQCPASPAQPPNCLFHYNWGATSHYCCVRFSALTHMFCSKKKKSALIIMTMMMIMIIEFSMSYSSLPDPLTKSVWLTDIIPKLFAWRVILTFIIFSQMLFECEITTLFAF